MISKKIAILKNRKNFLDESLRVLFLLLAAGYVALPHLTSSLMTPSIDAQTYFFLVSDFLTQFRAGIFPSYVTHNIFYPMGIPILPQAPYIFFLAGLFDFITAHTLSLGAIFNFTLVFSIFLATFGFYFLLLQLNASLRWPAALLSALYIFSPGVTGLIYIWTMYFSAMALPWVPLLFYGIIRSFRQQDYIASCLIGMSFALLWMAHPPIAFMCMNITLLAQLIYFIFQSRTLKTLQVISASYLVFLVLSLFYFFSVSAIGSNNIDGSIFSTQMLFHPVSKEFISYLMKTLHDTVGQVLSLTNANNFRINKLGISLWFLFLIAAVISWKRSIPYQKILVALFIFMSVLVLPVPGVTKFIWSYFPKFSEQLISFQPGDRLYIIMAALCIFIIFTAFENARPKFKKLLLIFSIGGVIWSGWEMHYVMNTEFSYLFNHDARVASVDFTKTISLPENVRPFTMTYYMGHGAKDAFFDPVFENFIVAKNGTILQSSKNILMEKCKLSETASQYVARFTTGKDNYIDGPTFSLEHGKRYFLGFVLDAKNVDWILIFRGRHFYREYSAHLKTLVEGKLNIVSLWHSELDTKEIKIVAVGHCLQQVKECRLRLKHICFEQFNPMDNEFPIHLLSLAPYKALLTGIKHEGFLETNLTYIKNYSVKVNQVPTAYFQSSHNKVLIPIQSGQSIVEITFKFTLVMVIALVISSLGWIFILYWLLFLMKKRNVQNF